VKFILDADQRDFASSLDALLASSDTVAVARAWAEGDSAPGLKLWARLAEQGVLSLATDATPTELCIAFEALGRYAVPGPWVESAAYLPVALGREIDGVATVALPPHVPYALDADVADQVYVGDALTTEIGDLVVSVDRTRRLFEVPGVSRHAPLAPQPPEAFDLAVLATAAQLLGALADVRIALDFARPLVFGAALGEVPASAAKVAAGDAAYLASRTGLQVHGAIGYTEEFDLSLWITKVRALVTAWGTPAHHRARLLEALVG
jgi:alkylation response protein AidB-like acyl-CoA dehydrogenase